ncbi:MAG: hypothetical protein AMK70_13145 [Nitrospira bacterium SG8_35_1]|nr:MAG: hypothetical protein AMK70_13145 [Nitrospira bacterium SG8_35_1]
MSHHNKKLISSSSTAGKVEHFPEVSEKTVVEAALAAGIVHRAEVPNGGGEEAYEGAGDRDAMNSDTITAL